jgi:phosphatidylglycerophosphatase A
VVARWLATWFGSGLAPVAPGTVGTIGALPLVVLLALGPPLLLPVAALLTTLVGVWAAGRTATALGRKDPGEVVIDEEPGPVDALQRVPGGWGIVLDDVAAGLLAAAVTWLGWGLLAGHWTGLLP